MHRQATTSSPTIFIPYSAHIADLNVSDTNQGHYLDLATALSETRTIVCILFISTRTGTGSLTVYPNEGGSRIFLPNDNGSPDYPVAIATGTQRLSYHFTVAYDSYYIYCTGYNVLDE